MNRLFVFLLACVFAQFSYGQKELSIKEMEDSMAHGNLNIQVDLATEYIVGNKVEQNHAIGLFHLLYICFGIDFAI